MHLLVTTIKRLVSQGRLPQMFFDIQEGRAPLPTNPFEEKHKFFDWQFSKPSSKPLFSRNNPEIHVQMSCNAKTIPAYFKSHVLEQIKIQGASSRKEIILFGHSNAGKSSLLNQLLQQEISKVSKTPGKTHELIFTRLTGSSQPGYYLVDAPGYGIASGASKTEMQSWKKLIRYYITRFPCTQALCLIDSAGIKGPDELLFQMLEALQKPFIVVLTKCDRGEAPLIQQQVRNKVKGLTQINRCLHLTSAKYDLGISELRHHLTFLLNQRESSQKL